MELKSKEEIEIMRKGGSILAKIFERLELELAPGITTYDLARKAENFMKEYKVKPAFKGYKGYPDVICISINEEIVHGIPSQKKVIKDGDIVSIDNGIEYEGFFLDASKTYPVGEVSTLAMKLIKVTEEALWRGIEEAKVGRHLSDVSWAIQEHVEKNGFNVIRDFVGHGIGRRLHEPPNVLNYGPPGMGPILKEGLVIAIEPMVVTGSYEVKILENGWTAVTADGGLSAHFEHTVAITKNGPQVLTVD
ncbi:MAG TPA: type I methionyl aminopeptidase [Dictyoglomaceae bacterium]|nr:type I methionyl aminopeptidase [Dictyoglomaceae bacterium]HOL38817.1 type I methionyl aminopeptidase [Dictyoglomaceae bacterium]HPP15435.1 type I methionyl aminopeptidase [Dictyoglomaceae bacterium]